MESLKREAGVEPSLRSSLSGVPPAHDIQHVTVNYRDTPGDAFGRHFLRCFFCHIGDRYIDDHFCEEGRELIVAMLDEVAGV